MGLAVVIAVSFLACVAVFGLLILAMELTAGFWFSEGVARKDDFATSKDSVTLDNFIPTFWGS